MNSENQNGKANLSKSKGRGCLIWLSRIVVSILGLAMVGTIFEPMAEAADAKAYPPPGQLVDVGGYRLHINCTGSGSPTVVIDAGLGDWSTSWGFVQAKVAKTTRVCTYDRAGMGWSDAGPLPRDAAQFAQELHTLLQNANIPGPYVMVGHSMGGFVVRVFAHDYSSEVSGVVLIESMNPRQIAEPATEGQPQPNLQSRVYSVLTGLARVGAVRMLARPVMNILSPQIVPNENAYYSRFAHPQTMQTTRDESLGLSASGAEAAVVKSFGDLPLIVLTGRLHNDPPDWQDWQTELLQLSSNSQHLFAENSAHTVQIDEPDAATAAIIKMVERVRQSIQK
jgi:pimeloyl-ACP methyl ester carboxylesterase